MSPILRCGLSERPVAVANYAYWNPADKNANTTLSNSNKTATNNTGTNAARVVRSLTSKNTGKFYVECVVTAHTDTNGFGFATSGAALTTYLGGTSTGWGFWGNYVDGRRRYNNNAFVAYALAAGNHVNGSVVGMAIDLDNGRAWWSVGNTFISGDPVAGTGAMATFTGGTTMFLACDPFGVGSSRTLRTNPAEHSHSPPSGFTAGWPI